MGRVSEKDTATRKATRKGSKEVICNAGVVRRVVQCACVCAECESVSWWFGDGEEKQESESIPVRLTAKKLTTPW